MSKQKLNQTGIERPENLSPLPLCQFKPGQSIYFKFAHGNDHYGYSFGTFVSLVRGIVEIRYQPPWTPNWLDERKMETMFPGGIARVRARSCYLWGRDDEARKAGISWPHCHWFKDTKTPII